MTTKEAILAYQINVVETKLEDVNFEIRGWEEKNKRHVERNDKLRSEQELLIQHLLKQAKDVEKAYDAEEIKTRDDVIETMKEKWDRQRERERELTDIKSQIARKETDIEKIRKEVDNWLRYKNKGQFEHKKQIEILEQELRDMQNSFDEMAGHLNKSLEKTKAEIEIYTDDTLAKQKDLASDKAMEKLDKHSRQEVLDNDWLKREVAIHSVEMEKIKTDVEKLEKRNLEIMSQLFDCTIDDLKISRNFYLTQFEDGENLEESSILEIDLNQLLINERTPITTPPSKLRPKSATHRAIEEKILSIVKDDISDEDDDGDAEEEEGEDEIDDLDDKIRDTKSNNDFYKSLFFEVEDFSDYLQLGPLELKLLNVNGTQMRLHPQGEPTDEELAALDCNPDTWPVTQPMIKNATNQ
ncbi:hypothetical protein SNE40_005727 [Patella caerulea]